MDDTSHPEDRFRRIEGLYHQALKMPAEERPGFFARACAGEDDLRREVEKLLAFDRKAGSYMESPALENSLYFPRRSPLHRHGTRLC